jgi:hypothetical protein
MNCGLDPNEHPGARKRRVWHQGAVVADGDRHLAHLAHRGAARGGGRRAPAAAREAQAGQGDAHCTAPPYPGAGPFSVGGGGASCAPQEEDALGHRGRGLTRPAHLVTPVRVSGGGGEVVRHAASRSDAARHADGAACAALHGTAGSQAATHASLVLRPPARVPKARTAPTITPVQLRETRLRTRGGEVLPPPVFPYRQVKIQGRAEG